MVAESEDGRRLLCARLFLLDVCLRARTKVAVRTPQHCVRTARRADCLHPTGKLPDLALAEALSGESRWRKGAEPARALGRAYPLRQAGHGHQSYGSDEHGD